jgi:hypothetical protein
MTPPKSNADRSIGLEVQQELSWLRELSLGRIEDCSEGQPFGNSFVTYGNRHILVRFVRDRAEILASVASVRQPNRWYNLQQVCELVGGDRKDTCTLAELGDLLRTNYHKILLALGPKLEQSKPQLDDLEQRRFKEIWDKL